MSHLTPRLASACDLVLARVVESDLGSDQRREGRPTARARRRAVPSGIASLVVQVDGGSVDHVADVVAQLASKRR